MQGLYMKINHQKYSLKFLVLSMSILLIGCSFENPSSKEEGIIVKPPQPLLKLNKQTEHETGPLNTICSKIALDEDALPVMVLDGTDVYERSKFKRTHFKSGNYITETGGAVISLDVTLLNNKVTSITRKYKEPTLPSDDKTYQNLCVNDSQIYSNSVLLTFVNGGILLWESNSENEFISDELFIYLKELK